MIPSLLVHTLKGDLLVRSKSAEERRIQAVVASDLMSDVLVVAQEDFLLVTSLASDQMIRTADLVGAAGVVLVNGKRPPASVLRLAEDLDITLIRTPLPKYEACLAIGSALASAAEATP
jgi:hypothetical protein